MEVATELRNHIKRIYICLAQCNEPLDENTTPWSESQLQAYMNNPLPSPSTQTGLLAYYTFDNLINKQGNPTWNASVAGTATINKTNPACPEFIADSFVSELKNGAM